MNVLRHDKTYLIGTDLDPIEDLLNLLSSLKSKGFTSDVLHEIHGFSNQTEIVRLTSLISNHIDNAIGLANQGFDGPPQTSFLPLYYASLNLLKAYLLFLGKRIELNANRWHGAKYDESEMRKQFLNERIKILNRGTIPLAYRAITGKTIGRNGIEITMKELYSCISSIGVEYSTITKNNNCLLVHQSNIVEDAPAGHYLKVEILDNFYKAHPPRPRTLKAFSGLTLVTPPEGNPYYTSHRIAGNFEIAKIRLLRTVKRNLISDQAYRSILGTNFLSQTPVNGRYHVMNEDLSILLAYFHLSNVVRYNPEHLYRLMDSKYWVLMLALRKHGFLRFLKLMWGNINKTCFDID